MEVLCMYRFSQFQYYEDRAGDWRWRFVVYDDVRGCDIIAVSTNRPKTLADCLASIERVRGEAPYAAVVRVDE